MLDVNDLEMVAAAIRVCGFPLAQSAFTRICKELAEAQNTPTNIARDEICRCKPVYQIIAVEGLIKIGYPFCPRCGGKLSPVA